LGAPAEVWPRIGRHEAVTVSHSFAASFGVWPGDLLTLDTPRGPLRRPVAGVAEEFLSPRGSVQMSRALYDEFWADQQVSAALVLADPGRDLDEVRTAIAARLGHRYGLRILRPREVVAHY